MLKKRAITAGNTVEHPLTIDLNDQHLDLQCPLIMAGGYQERESEVSDQTIVAVDVVEEEDEQQTERPEGEGLTCRVCYGSEEEGPLISPCECSGGMKNIHIHCLRKWLEKRPIADEVGDGLLCEICHSKYRIKVTRQFSWDNVCNAQACSSVSEAIVLTFCLSCVIGMYKYRIISILRNFRV